MSAIWPLHPKTCQRHRASFAPIPQRSCDHEADFKVLHVPTGTEFALCGCCFLELGTAEGVFVVRIAVVDIRTGMALPPSAAMDRAKRLN